MDRELTFAARTGLTDVEIAAVLVIVCGLVWAVATAGWVDERAESQHTTRCAAR